MTDTPTWPPNTWVHVKGTEDVFQVYSVRHAADGNPLYTLRDMQDIPMRKEFKPEELEPAPDNNSGPVKPERFW